MREMTYSLLEYAFFSMGISSLLLCSIKRKKVKYGDRSPPVEHLCLKYPKIKLNIAL